MCNFLVEFKDPGVIALMCIRLGQREPQPLNCVMDHEHVIDTVVHVVEQPPQDSIVANIPLYKEKRIQWCRSKVISVQSQVIKAIQGVMREVVLNWIWDLIRYRSSSKLMLVTFFWCLYSCVTSGWVGSHALHNLTYVTPSVPFCASFFLSFFLAI